MTISENYEKRRISVIKIFIPQIIIFVIDIFRFFIEKHEFLPSCGYMKYRSRGFTLVQEKLKQINFEVVRTDLGYENADPDPL